MGSSFGENARFVNARRPIRGPFPFHRRWRAPISATPRCPSCLGGSDASLRPSVTSLALPVITPPSLNTPSRKDARALNAMHRLCAITAVLSVVFVIIAVLGSAVAQSPSVVVVVSPTPVVVVTTAKPATTAAVTAPVVEQKVRFAPLPLAHSCLMDVCATSG